MPKAPYWAKRRLNLILNLLPEQPVQDGLKSLAKTLRAYNKPESEFYGDGNVRLLLTKVQINLKFPRGSKQLILQLALKKELPHREALNYLTPPFRAVSFRDKCVTMADIFGSFEEMRSHINEVSRHDYQPVETLAFDEGEVYLHITADATKEELISFIEEYYNSEIETHLYSSGWSSHNKRLLNKKAKIQPPKITLTKAEQKLLDLSKQGLTPYGISKNSGLGKNSPQALDTKLKRIKNLKDMEYKII